MEGMKFNEIIKWLSKKTIEEKVLFIEILLAEITVMNRSIVSRPDDTDTKKKDYLMLSSELSHRLWGIHFETKNSIDENIEKKIEQEIMFYVKQSNEFAVELGATLKSTMNRFIWFEERKYE